MPLKKKDLITLYTNLVRARKMDETMIDSIPKGRGRPFTSGIGEEAVGVGACTFLRKDDYLVPSHRGNGCPQLLPKGMSSKTLMSDFYRRTTGSGKGFGLLSADMDLGIAGQGATMGSCFPIAVGLGIAAQAKGKGQAVVCIFGEGTSNRGTFHESMNLAALWKLPIVWVCENNQYALWMPVCDGCASEDIAGLAAGYCVPSAIVDGQDVVAVHEAVMSAVERARKGEGPSLIECKTYRIRPHYEMLPDLKGCEPRPQEEIEKWKKRDPIKLFQEKLLKQGILIQADIDRIDKELTKEAEEADEFAWGSPEPKPEDLDNALYAD
jgi:acetoin:2,6-dichlorophenolindophenol oxidoreductase subunit alpha